MNGFSPSNDNFILSVSWKPLFDFDAQNSMQTKHISIYNTLYIYIHTRRLGRADFVGGIDNEALDFGQLESFVHLPSSNATNSNGNAAVTIAVTAITAVTTAQPLITTSTSATVSTATTHGSLPESPPGSLDIS